MLITNPYHKNTLAFLLLACLSNTTAGYAAEPRSTTYRYNYGQAAVAVNADNQHVLCDDCPLLLQPKPYVEPKKISLLPQPPVPFISRSIEERAEKDRSVAKTIDQTQTVKHVTKFKFNSTTVSKKEQARIKAFLKSLPDGSVVSVRVDGHASTPGSSKYNLALSKRRADKISSLVKKFGTRIDKITGYGEKRATGKAIAADQKVEIIVWEES